MTAKLTGLLIIVAVTFGLGLQGCGGSTAPDGGPIVDGSGLFEGSFDGGSDSFVLKDLDSHVPGSAAVRVQLIGRNLQIDSAGRITIDVALRNADRVPLYAPAEVVVHRFRPGSVFPTNADWITCPNDSTLGPVPADGCRWGFDYSHLFGDDNVLPPGETSGFRPWSFHNPDLTPFSFAAEVRVSMAPDRPRISGLFFGDKNENGHLDADEGPFGGGWVVATGPGLVDREVFVAEDGRYSIPVREPGLYTLTAYPPPTLGLVPVRFTTPNPLEVLLPPGPNGVPESFLHADFGLANEPLFPHPPIRLVESTRGLPLDPYDLLGARVDGRFLSIIAGFSGCSDDQPFQLLMVGGFMESFPVQARLVLSHDDRDELCDAYFTRELTYDLLPLIRAYGENGSGDVILLNLEDATGAVHRLELIIP